MARNDLVWAKIEELDKEHGWNTVLKGWAEEVEDENEAIPTSFAQVGGNKSPQKSNIRESASVHSLPNSDDVDIVPSHTSVSDLILENLNTHTKGNSSPIDTANTNQPALAAPEAGSDGDAFYTAVSSFGSPQSFYTAREIFSDVESSSPGDEPDSSGNRGEPSSRTSYENDDIRDAYILPVTLPTTVLPVGRRPGGRGSSSSKADGRLGQHRWAHEPYLFAEENETNEIRRQNTEQSVDQSVEPEALWQNQPVHPWPAKWMTVREPRGTNRGALWLLKCKTQPHKYTRGFVDYFDEVKVSFPKPRRVSHPRSPLRQVTSAAGGEAETSKDDTKQGAGMAGDTPPPSGAFLTAVFLRKRKVVPPPRLLSSFSIPYDQEDGPDI